MVGFTKVVLEQIDMKNYNLQDAKYFERSLSTVRHRVLKSTIIKKVE